MKNLNRKFTEWYVKRGYEFYYVGMESRFRCPWYIKPLLILFSPSVYFQKAWGEKIVEWFEEGIKSQSEKFPGLDFLENKMKGD